MRQAELRQSDAARNSKGKANQHRTLAAVKQQPMKPCFTRASALGVAGGGVSWRRSSAPATHKGAQGAPSLRLLSGHPERNGYGQPTRVAFEAVLCVEFMKIAKAHGNGHFAHLEVR